MTKRKKKIIITIFVIIIVIIGVFKFTEYGNVARWYLTPLLEKKLDGFAKYQNDYQAIVDKLITLRNEGKKVKKDDYLVVEKDIVYSSIPNEKIVLTDEEKKSLINVEKTFVGEFCVMDTIMIYPTNYIGFASSSCDLEVVYSEDGSVPASKAEYEDLVIEYKIKKITSNWYTVEEK